MASFFAGGARPDAVNGDIWHKSAPSAVRKAAAHGNLPRSWDAWSKHLSERVRPVHPDDLFPAGESSLHWGLPTEWRVHSSAMIAPGSCCDGEEQRILGWLGEVAGGTLGVEYALDALTLSRRLPCLAERLSADTWFALLGHLIEAVGEAGSIDPQQQPLLAQLLAGELPLTLAYLFPELKPCRALAAEARHVLATGLADLLDGDGLLHGSHIALARPLLACWTRCRVLGKGMRRACFPAPVWRQYKHMVRHVLRFTRHDGSAMLAPAAPDGDEELLKTAMALGGGTSNLRIAARAAAKAKNGKRGRSLDAALPEPAAQGEWAAAALLRTDWSRRAERLAVVYTGREVELELDTGKEVLLSGSWGFDVTRDGKPLTPTSEWDQVCWVTDDDIDYLELQIELDGGVRVQRQMALAREDRFLFLADAVLSGEPGRLEYRACLPLWPGVEFRPAEESREGYLEGTKRRALVLPLALAEWRSLWAPGELQATAAGLEATHAAKASCLYIPLFFDLNRHRFTRPYTWRRLTVAESLAAQPGDVAVGYRIAIGKEQWLIYRSLAANGNRTLLGHNLSTEALIARFDSTGEVESLIEVE